MNANIGCIEDKPSDIASPPSKPANTPPIAEAKNHKPNIWPIYLFGEYLEKAANPIGDNANSPHV